MRTSAISVTPLHMLAYCAYYSFRTDCHRTISNYHSSYSKQHFKGPCRHQLPRMTENTSGVVGQKVTQDFTILTADTLSNGEASWKLISIHTPGSQVYRAFKGKNLLLVGQLF